MRSTKALCAALLVLATASFAHVGCGSESSEFATTKVPDGGKTGTSTETGENPEFLDGSQPKDPCEGLRCAQVKCDPGVTTTISGIVTAPNGTLPLYNAIVYVPNKPLDPVPEGASCDRCGNVSGDPVVATITDTQGKFVLKNVPVADDIPIVIQVGKWRRELKLNVTNKCADNPISDGNLTRLPKNSSEGHIPKIAVSTGWCDQLACLLPKLGLDASEYSLDHNAGRLHLFRGSQAKPLGAAAVAPAPAPTGTPDAQPFWSDVNQLKTYDMLMLSCECGEHLETKPAAAINAVYDYASAGGRVFASHFHYAWFQGGNGASSPLSTVAQWFGKPTNPEDPQGPFLIDQSFPKGQALADWLVNVQASTTKGEMPISQPRENVGAVQASSAQRWVYAKKWAAYPIIPDPIIPEATKYLTVNAPVGQPVDQQCGKATYADMHLYAGDEQAAPGIPDDQFPGTCSTTLTPEEKALAFLFFDLSSCVQDEKIEPAPPVK